MRQICIHGHFYQPPRENPWTGEIDPQPSAAPFANWNERITEECYQPNCGALIMGADGNVLERMNTYRHMSFNFGPTLMSWLAQHQPDTHDTIIAADRVSVAEHDGHGNAIAQGYHHVILPLASARDRQTELKWGIEDFRARFRRRPEGLWLPETAVDTPTMESMVDAGLKFVILAPEQAATVRPIGASSWTAVTAETLETGRPYRVNLPSGRSLTAFFYGATPAQGVAFGGWLHNGETMAEKLAETNDGLCHFATDGESYGHHHRKGDMALAYCIRTLLKREDVRLTNYGEYLAQNPPEWEAKIVEKSAWSCAHGVGRWSENCGCAMDPARSGQQEWRSDLREALNGLRDKIDAFYVAEMHELEIEPWGTRDAYIHDVLKASAHVTALEDGPVSTVSRDTPTKANRLKELLEIQRHRLMMFTSCGWFFDDPSGLETVQILRYAHRAIVLTRQAGGPDLESGFLAAISSMKSAETDTPTGHEIYSTLILDHAATYQGP